MGERLRETMLPRLTWREMWPVTPAGQRSLAISEQNRSFHPHMTTA
jgi:hypothetical protein